MLTGWEAFLPVYHDTQSKETMNRNKLFGAVTLAAFMGVAACNGQQDDTFIDDPATEDPATAPTIEDDPAFQDDPALQDDPMRDDTMMHDDTMMMQDPRQDDWDDDPQYDPGL